MAYRLAESNLGIALLGFILWIVRVALILLEASAARVDLCYDTVLVILWSYSINSLSSIDFSDPRHPSLTPCYLLHGCDTVEDGIHTYCILAKVIFGMSILALYVLLCIFCSLSHLCCIFSRQKPLMIIQNRVFYASRIILYVLLLVYVCGGQATFGTVPVKSYAATAMDIQTQSTDCSFCDENWRCSFWPSGSGAYPRLELLPR